MTESSENPGLLRRLADGVEILQREWELLLDPDSGRRRDSKSGTRPPIPIPERSSAPTYPDYVLTGTGIRELHHTARTMEQQEKWYAALQLYLEVLRRSEEAGNGSFDVTLLNRIGDLHRRLATEWYVEAVDRYAERDLRRGAIALCEKALHLDPHHDEARRRVERLVELVERAEEERSSSRSPVAEAERADVSEAKPEEGPETTRSPEAPRADPPEAPPVPDDDSLPRYLVIPPVDEELRRLRRRRGRAFLIAVGSLLAVILAILQWL